VTSGIGPRHRKCHLASLAAPSQSRSFISLLVNFLSSVLQVSHRLLLSPSGVIPSPASTLAAKSATAPSPTCSISCAQTRNVSTVSPRPSTYVLFHFFQRWWLIVFFYRLSTRVPLLLSCTIMPGLDFPKAPPSLMSEVAMVDLQSHFTSRKCISQCHLISYSLFNQPPFAPLHRPRSPRYCRTCKGTYPLGTRFRLSSCTGTPFIRRHRYHRNRGLCTSRLGDGPRLFHSSASPRRWIHIHHEMGYVSLFLSSYPNMRLIGSSSHNWPDEECVSIQFPMSRVPLDSHHYPLSMRRPGPD
jgi:hypothetical protein